MCPVPHGDLQSNEQGPGSRMADDDLLGRTRTLRHELDHFISTLRTRNRLDKFVEYAHFRGDVEHQIQRLEKASESNAQSKLEDSRELSNVSFLEAVWATAKCCSRLVSVGSHSSPAHVIADGGRKWIKISAISERRLLVDMAKHAWEWDSMSATESDGDDIAAAPEADIADLTLVKAARKLAHAALKAQEHAKGKEPSVQLILTRISSRKVTDIDRLLAEIRGMGVAVQCANEILPPPPLEEFLETVGTEDFENFSHVLNLDCTILLALISDISHATLPTSQRLTDAVRRQIELEKDEKLLPSLLWPAMSNHPLVCTRAAAERVMDIVQTLGTESEVDRATTLLSYEKKSMSQLLEEFQRLTCHDVPRTWRLPVKVVEEVQIESSLLPPVAKLVASQLSEINESVFLYGWAKGQTTLSSNMATAKLIDAIIAMEQNQNDVRGPHIWICRVTRSLLAKEKA